MGLGQWAGCFFSWDFWDFLFWGAVSFLKIVAATRSRSCYPDLVHHISWASFLLCWGGRYTTRNSGELRLFLYLNLVPGNKLEKGLEFLKVIAWWKLVETCRGFFVDLESHSCVVWIHLKVGILYLSHSWSSVGFWISYSEKVIVARVQLVTFVYCRRRNWIEVQTSRCWSASSIESCITYMCLTER